jgi:hypothetical protein
MTLNAEDNLQFNGQVPFFAFSDFNFPSFSGTGNPSYLSDPFGTAGVVNPFPSKPPTKNLNFADAGYIPIGGAVSTSSTRIYGLLMFFSTTSRFSSNSLPALCSKQATWVVTVIN